MATGPITKRSVDALNATAGAVYLWDKGGDKADSVKGFGVKAMPSGHKVYIFQYRPGGRGTSTRRITIGEHGPLTPDAARKIAISLRSAVIAGIDPIEAKRSEDRAKAAAIEAEREAERLAHDLKIETLGARFLKESISVDAPASYAFVDGALRLHINPVIGDEPLPSITRAQVTRMLNRIPAHQPAVRRNAFAVLRWLCRWSLEAGEISQSPLLGISAPPTVKSRDRVLSDEEVVLVWKAAGAMGKPFGPIFRLLLATGQRREEVAALDWSELSRKGTLWTLPASRAKNNEQHIIPLSALTIAELDAIAGVTDEDEDKRRWPRHGLIFTTNGKTAVSGHSKAKRGLDDEMLDLARKAAEDGAEDPEEIKLKAWRVHDLRRTVATGLQRLGVRLEVTESVLNHVSGSRSGITGVYQRHDWAEEKRAALAAWNAHLERLLCPTDATNVVPIEAARA